MIAAMTGCSESQRRDPRDARATPEKLWIVASNFADDTNVKVVKARAVRTTDTRALPLLFGRPPEDIQAMNQPEWLMEVEANRPFECECTGLADGSGRYDPRFMLLLVDPQSFRIDQQGVAFSEHQDLESLGQVEELP